MAVQMVSSVIDLLQMPLRGLAWQSNTASRTTLLLPTSRLPSEGRPSMCREILVRYSHYFIDNILFQVAVAQSFFATLVQKYLSVALAAVGEA